jgi:hypothetical protein
MKPFDIVKPTYKYIKNEPLIEVEDYGKAKEVVGIVVCVSKSGNEAAVSWFGTDNLSQAFKVAWFEEDEIEVIDNLPRVFANQFDYPHYNQGNVFFPIK